MLCHQIEATEHVLCFSHPGAYSTAVAGFLHKAMVPEQTQ
jgi:hypothetical protein